MGGDNGNPKPPRNYEVGYGKTPEHTRFKKGSSGNPYGRPRKTDKKPFEGRANPVRDIVIEEMARPVTLTENGQTVELEALRAIVRAATFAAIKGRVGAARVVLGYASEADRQRRDEIERVVEAVESYKKRWGPIFRDARLTGKPEPSQLPHPDHVNIDPYTGELVLSGPQDKATKKSWDFLKWQLRTSERMAQSVQRALDASPDDEDLKARLKMAKQVVRKNERNVPSGWNWREELGWEDQVEAGVFAALRIPEGTTFDW